MTVLGMDAATAAAFGGRIYSWDRWPGGVRALGVASPKRIPTLPDLPTIDEGGVHGVHSDIWISIVAPKGTSPDIVNKMNREIVKIMTTPDVANNIRVQGMEPMTGTPAEFGTLIQEDFGRWAKLIKALGIRAE